MQDEEKRSNEWHEKFVDHGSNSEHLEDICARCGQPVSQTKEKIPSADPAAVKRYRSSVIKEERAKIAKWIAAVYPVMHEAFLAEFPVEVGK